MRLRLVRSRPSRFVVGSNTASSDRWPTPVAITFGFFLLVKEETDTPSGPELGVQRRTDFGIIFAIGAALMR